MSAHANLTKLQRYSWSIEKTSPPNQVPFVIPSGDSESASFSISAERSGPLTSFDISPISGKICLRNIGPVTTRGLVISTNLQIFNSGTWQNIDRIRIDPPREIPAGGRACYDFEFAIDEQDFDTESRLRVVAFASILNRVGSEGGASSIRLFDEVTVIRQTRQIDSSARISDSFDCPADFACAPLNQTWIISESSIIPVSISLTNNSLNCGFSIATLNRANLVQTDSNQSKASEVSVLIYSGTCPLAHDFGS